MAISKKNKENIPLYYSYLNDIKKEYKENISFFDDSDILNKKHIFIDKFVRCEFYIKNMLYHYYHNKNEYKVLKDIKLNMNSIIPCMSFYNFNFDNGILNKIFGSNAKRGQKSCKKLRDGIVHYFSANDGYELNKRFDELIDYMDKFLRLFD